MTTRETEVLVVDDEEQLRRLAQRALSRAGLRVQTAASGEEAMAILNQGKRFDTIVSDLMMPGMGGTELSGLFEANATLKAVPIVFLTAAITKEQVEAVGGRIGKYPFLAKPIVLTEVAASLKRTLGE